MNTAPQKPAAQGSEPPREAAQRSSSRQAPSVMLAGKPTWILGTLVAILLLACAVAVFSMWVILRHH